MDKHCEDDRYLSLTRRQINLKLLSYINKKYISVFPPQFWLSYNIKKIIKIAIKLYINEAYYFRQNNDSQYQENKVII